MSVAQADVSQTHCLPIIQSNTPCKLPCSFLFVSCCSLEKGNFGLSFFPFRPLLIGQTPHQRPRVSPPSPRALRSLPRSPPQGQQADRRVIGKAQSRLFRTQCSCYKKLYIFQTIPRDSVAQLNTPMQSLSVPRSSLKWPFLQGRFPIL